MKKQSILLQALTVLMTMALALTGCQNNTTQQDYNVAQNLTVETVHDTISVSCDSEDSGIVSGFELGAEVDFPVDGPQPLMDSIKMFVKGELYHMFDWNYTEEDYEEMIHLPYKQVCKWDGDNIVTVFLDNYRPLYEKYGLGVGAHYLNLKIVAQTETFVTYFGEYTWCGASCSTGYCYYTFRKKDGSLLNSITNMKKIRSFLKAYPQYKDVFSLMTDDLDLEFLGLLEEGVKCDYLFWPEFPNYNPDEDRDEIVIPYSEIKPYLSQEAQELIQND